MFLKGVSDRNTTLPKTLNYWHCCVSIIKTVKKIGSIASHKLPYTNYELVKFPYKKGRGQQLLRTTFEVNTEVEIWLKVCCWGNVAHNFLTTQCNLHPALFKLSSYY